MDWAARARKSCKDHEREIRYGPRSARAVRVARRMSSEARGPAADQHGGTGAEQLLPPGVPQDPHGPELLRPPDRRRRRWRDPRAEEELNPVWPEFARCGRRPHPGSLHPALERLADRVGPD